MSSVSNQADTPGWCTLNFPSDSFCPFLIYLVFKPPCIFSFYFLSCSKHGTCYVFATIYELIHVFKLIAIYRLCITYYMKVITFLQLYYDWHKSNLIWTISSEKYWHYVFNCDPVTTRSSCDPWNILCLFAEVRNRKRKHVSDPQVRK